MPLSKDSPRTSEDYWKLPDGRRAELIDGRLYDMAPPGYLHQKLVMKISAAISNYIQYNNGGCEVLPAPFAVNLTGNDKTWVEPDISVICDKSRLSERGCEGAPDWIIEIVSPSSQTKDYGIKLFKYRTAGVREYWIVNPATRTVNVYDFEKETATAQYTFNDKISACMYPDLCITIGELLL